MKKELRRFYQGLAAFLLIAVTAFVSPAVSHPISDVVTDRVKVVSEAPDGPFSSQVSAGLAYFQTRAQEQLPLVEDLLAALQSGDLDAAKQAYIDARPPYEEIEVFAGSFEDEDSDIDARPYSFDDGEESADFRGFHRIEALIFRDRDTEAAVPYAEGLISSVNSLIDKLNDPSNFSAADNFDGMMALSTEVPAKKISSEEETWSDQSLLIFKHNWIGIYSQAQPFLSSLDPSLAAEITIGYKDCMATVAPFFNEGEVAAAPYSSLNPEQRRAISDASYKFRNSIVKAATALDLV